MKRHFATLSSFALSTFLSLVAPLSSARAAFTTWGDVEPSDPTAWTDSVGYVGNTSNGTLTLDSGSGISSLGAYIGYSSGVTGVMTVGGTGSTWSSRNIDVGEYGNGTLRVTGGGAVSSWDSGFVGHSSGSTGVVTVDGAGSIWAIGYTGSIGYLSVGDGWDGSSSGTVTMTGGGAVSNDMGYIGYFPGSTGVVTVAGAGSKWNSGYILVGGSGSGTLTVARGGAVVSNGGAEIRGSSGSIGVVTVDGDGSTWNTDSVVVGVVGRGGTLAITHGGAVNSSQDDIIGLGKGSTGAATVSGSGSIWTKSGGIYVGESGNGALNVTNGGAFSSNGIADIAYESTSTGVVTVNGAGSTCSTQQIYVGDFGCGTLTISGGGAVTAGTISVNNKSLVAIDAGCRSSLTIGGGTGTISNGGTVRVLAGAGVPAGNIYSPISAGTWTGAGTYQALGGTWDSTNHRFTVSSVATAASGLPVTIDLASQQRVSVSDGTSGWKVGESFLATTSSSTLTCTTTAISSTTLTALSGSLGTGETVLSGWTLAATSGYASGTPLYLSFGVGAAQLLDDLQVWQYNGTWSQYAPADLTYDRAYASLTVTNLGVYAVTGDLVLMGDANRDDTVNGADLNVVLSNYNQTGATWAQGDFNGDGTVNGADLNVVLSNYNQSLSVSSAAAVPEPATLVLLAAGLLNLLAYPPRKRAD